METGVLKILLHLKPEVVSIIYFLLVLKYTHSLQEWSYTEMINIEYYVFAYKEANQEK